MYMWKAWVVECYETGSFIWTFIIIPVHAFFYFPLSVNNLCNGIFNDRSTEYNIQQDNSYVRGTHDNVLAKSIFKSSLLLFYVQQYSKVEDVVNGCRKKLCALERYERILDAFFPGNLLLPICIRGLFHLQNKIWQIQMVDCRTFSYLFVYNNYELSSRLLTPNMKWLH